MKCIKKKWRINENYKISNNYFSFIDFDDKSCCCREMGHGLAYGAGNFHSANATDSQIMLLKKVVEN